jgi:hypothetical protein
LSQETGSEGEFLPTPQDVIEQAMAARAAIRRAKAIVERCIDDPVRLKGK